MGDPLKRYIIHINGVVQGVGFRPYVYHLALLHFIKGWVLNGPNGVVIDAEGSPENLEAFARELFEAPPPLSHIVSHIKKEENPVGYREFEIRESVAAERTDSYISPDIATCEDCLREMRDPKDRRYAYPFINCTNCGPRFTITRGIPYDRCNTTMSVFEMCERCTKEYRDPVDRRFHAQPVSCKECGPHLFLLDSNGLQLAPGREVEQLRIVLGKGCIAAVKGLGGYHLCCNALNEDAIHLLRKRKLRDKKPFALMARDIGIVKQYCELGQEEEKLLTSYRRPIVLLKKKTGLPSFLEEAAPDNRYLGIMLPYTPLHYLLFDKGLELLVMTSGNISGEPICYKDEDALNRLSGIADYFLGNNREIHMRTDDSVMSIFRGKEYPIRRSRGYVPFPVDLGALLGACEPEGSLPCKMHPDILACGGELKNTFCLLKKGKAFLSHHIGDLENLETLRSYEEGIRHFETIFTSTPTRIAYDLHPEYLSTKYALKLHNVEKVPVQHHQAHIAGCMAENGVKEKVIGIAYDGTGYGEDGNIWGGELFWGDYSGFVREAHLEYLPLPGGEAAIHEPWRMAISYLIKYFGPDWQELLSGMDSSGRIPAFFKDIPDQKKEILQLQIAKKLNCPLTSSMGRLFDAVSALLGLCQVSAYEGQAAIKLENDAEQLRSGGTVGDAAGETVGETAEGTAGDNEGGIAEGTAGDTDGGTAWGITGVSAGKILECLAPYPYKIEEPERGKPGEKCRTGGLDNQHSEGSQQTGGSRWPEDSQRPGAMQRPWDSQLTEGSPQEGDIRQPGNDQQQAYSPLVINPGGLIEGLIQDMAKGTDTPVISGRFHKTVAEWTVDCCRRIRAERGTDLAVLSGGVFQNRILLELLVTSLERENFRVLVHHQIPANDGGIALGQAVMAAFWTPDGGRKIRALNV